MNQPPRPPQPSAHGQQGVPEIGVSDAEMIQFYQQVLANCQHQAGHSSMLVQKLRAALAERDARIAELEADVAARKEAATGELVEVSAEANIYREEFPGLKDIKPARQKRGEG